MINKLYLVLAFALLLALPLSSALEWDNVKSYDKTEQTVSVRNALGLGSEIASIKLDTPLYNYVPAGNDIQIGEMTFDSYQDYVNALGSVRTERIKGTGSKVYTYKIKSSEIVTRDKIVEECDKFNCTYKTFGTYDEEVVKWIPITKSELKQGKVTIGIFTDTKNGEIFDWIPTLYGKEIDEWAIVEVYESVSATWSPEEDGGNAQRGWVINPKINVNAISITKQSGVTGVSSGKIYVTTNGTVVGSVAFSGDVATFSSPIPLTAGLNYSITAGHTSGGWTRVINTSGLVPQDTGQIVWGTGVSYTDGGTTPSYSASGYNIIGLTIEYTADDTTVNVTLPQNGTSFTNNSIQLTVNSSNLNASIMNLVNTSLWVQNQSFIDIDCPNDPTCVAYYRLDGNAFDSTGRWNGTERGRGTSILPINVEGTYGGGEYFLGAGQYMNATIPVYNTTDTISLSAWINNLGVNNYSQSIGIIEIMKDDNNHLYEIGNPSSTLAQIRCGSQALSGGFTGASLTINRSQWYHVACNFISNSSGLISIATYINGKLWNNVSGLAQGVTGGTANQIRIGVQKLGNGRYFNGSIDDVRIYNRSLSAQEIWLIYNQTQPVYSESYAATNTHITNTSVTVAERGIHNIFAWTTNTTGQGAGDGDTYFYVEPEYEITLHEPINDTLFNTSNIRFSANATGGVIQNYNFTLLINGDNNYSVVGQLGDRTGFNITMDLPDGDYNWTAYITDFNGTNTTTQTRLFSVDATAPTINITYPRNKVDYLIAGNNITLNYTFTEANPSICSFNYNSSTANTTITCGTNSSFQVSGHTRRNVTAYINDTNNNFGYNISNWSYYVFQYDEDIDALVLSGATLPFVYNFSSQYTPTSVKLFYNGTANLATIANPDADMWTGSVDVNIPISNTQQVKNLYWNVEFSDGTIVNSSIYQQTISPIVFSICTPSVSTPVLNISAKDETTDGAINFTLEALFTYYNSNGSSATSLNYSFANMTDNYYYEFCVSPASTYINASATLSYDKTGYGTRSYYFNNAQFSNVTQNLTLYLLNSSLQTAVEFIVVDQSGNGISGAFINIQLWEIGTNTYNTINVIQTDPEGKSSADLQLNSAWYRYLVTYQGILYLVTSPLIETQTTRILTINTDAGTPYNFFNQVYGDVTFNNNTNTFAFTFTDTSGAVGQGCLEIFKVSASANIILANYCVNASSGTTFYTATENGTYIANGIAILTSVYGSVEKTIDSISVTIGRSQASAITGTLGLIIAAILLITIGAFAASANSLVLGSVLFVGAIIFIGWAGWVAFSGMGVAISLAVIFIFVGIIAYRKYF